MATTSSTRTALPRLATPWRHAFESGSPVRVDVVHMTDPLCPWAYSFEPALRAIEARYGDQLRFQTCMIGLLETVEEPAAHSPALRRELAQGTLGFRRYGMPITPHVRSRAFATGPACRLVKAAERQDPMLAEAVLRLLRLATYTTDLLLDEDEALAEVCGQVQGLDAERALDEMHGDRVRDAYLRDRATARDPSEIAVKLQRTARSERYSAPTLVLRNDAGHSAVVPGFQPFEAVDVALMNLEPRLTRLPVPSIETLLAAYPGGLTTQEVARVSAETTEHPDRTDAEIALIELAAAGRVVRTALGDDALWTLTGDLTRARPRSGRVPRDGHDASSVCELPARGH